MTRRVKEFIEIKDHESLDALIEQLKDVRQGLPEDAEAELRLRGDDVFGRKLTISYFRPQSVEELECEARYAEAEKQARQQALAKLQQELGVVCYPPGRKGKLSIVA